MMMVIFRAALSLEKGVAIIVKVCKGFGLTVPNGKTESMCKHPEEYRVVRFDFSAASQI